MALQSKFEQVRLRYAPPFVCSDSSGVCKTTISAMTIYRGRLPSPIGDWNFKR